MLRARHTVLFLPVLALAVPLSADHPQEPAGKIVVAGHMLSPRAGHTATLLKDGRVLVAGGMVHNREFLDSAELYDPVSRQFSSTGKMMTKRVGQVAALLLDGRVLLAGGWSKGSNQCRRDLRPGNRKIFVAPSNDGSSCRIFRGFVARWPSPDHRRRNG